MKTIVYEILKSKMANKKSLLLMLAFISMHYSFAQYEPGQLYLVATDPASIPVVKTTDRRSSVKVDNEALNSILTQYKVYEFKAPFPTAKTERLRSTFQLSCDCDEQELMKAFTQKAGDFYTEVERIPQAVPLHTPDDYLTVSSIPSCNLNLPNYHLDLINAKQAWDITQGNPNIKIAIIDQGFNPGHTDFLNSNGVNQVVYWDSLSGPPSHGTFVAGFVGAATDNATGLSSIGYDCKLMLYTGIGNYNLIIQAYQAGARVINMSWGGTGSSSTHQIIIDEAYNNGAVLVAAAGNGANNNSTAYYYPASYNHVISVTSVGPQDNHHHTYYHQNDNCIQKTMVHQYNNKVDIAAPGYEVVSLYSGGGYLSSSGTSFASPIVAGVAGLMLSANPNLTPDEVEAILKCSAVNIDAINPAYAGLLGAGRVNAFEAVSKAAAAVISPANPVMAVSFTPAAICGTNTATLTANVTGGSGPFTYEWNTLPVQTTATASGLSEGFYSVNITDNNCISNPFIEYVAATAALEVNAGVDTVICPGESVTLGGTAAASGGSGIYDFLWSTHDGIIQNSNSPALLVSPVANTSYTLHVVDASTQCAATSSVLVSVSNPCEIFSLTDVSEIDGQLSYSLYPNPFSEKTTLTFDALLENGKNITVLIYDLSGREVKRVSEVANQSITINRDNLPAGMYLYRLQEQNAVIGTGKLAVR